MSKNDDSVEGATQPAPVTPAEQGEPDLPSPYVTGAIDRRRTIIICAAIFFLALGARLLSFQDNRFEARKVQTAVTAGYRHTASLIRQGGVGAFFRTDSPLNDPNHLGHPPGYPILMALLYAPFGESDAALQIFQILADSASAVLVFLIALSLLGRTIGSIAGFLVAFAPQLTYNSVMLLPDTLAVLPLLVSIYLLTRAVKTPHLMWLVLAGAAIGVSCWLRANALLLAPFMTLFVPLLFARGSRLRYSLALVCGTILVIAPLTISNYVIHDHFIPVSLGAGQTLLEGISDYDEGGTLGIPNTDMGLMKWEAEFYNRPDYFGTLFMPDGVRRERMRLARGFAVIRSHPFWFLGVMARRGASMLKLERVRLVSTAAPVTHSFDPDGLDSIQWSAQPGDLLPSGKLISANAEVSITPEGLLQIKGDDSKYEEQFSSPPIVVWSHNDYVLRLATRAEQGRMIATLRRTDDNSELASAIIEPLEWPPPAEKPVNIIHLPFASGSADSVRLVFSNGGSKDARPLVQVGRVSLHPLGPSSFGWTRAARFPLNLIQRLFITAVMLPLSIAGILLLLFGERRRREVAILLIIPAYYVSVQSALHTEYRYVLAIHYFLFVFAATTLLWAARRAPVVFAKIKGLRRIYKRPASDVS